MQEARTVVVAAVMLLVGCRSEPARNDLPPVSAQVEAGTPSDPEVPVAPVRPPPTSNLSGTWELDRDPRPSSPTRMRLELRIDSVVSGEMLGTLVRYFAGNMGSDASDFPEFRGVAFGDSTFTISIWPTGMPNAGFTLAGRQGADTLHLLTFVVGPDTLSGGAARWMLRRVSE